MIMEQIFAVKPSEETSVGMATNGIPSIKALYRPKSMSVPPPTTTITSGLRTNIFIMFSIAFFSECKPLAVKMFPDQRVHESW